MVAKKKIDLLDLVEKIVGLNSKMRFAAIIDAKGNIREGIMKKGQTSLKFSKRRRTFLQASSRKTNYAKRIQSFIR